MLLAAHVSNMLASVFQSVGSRIPYSAESNANMCKYVCSCWTAMPRHLRDFHFQSVQRILYVWLCLCSPKRTEHTTYNQRTTIGNLWHYLCISKATKTWHDTLRKHKNQDHNSAIKATATICDAPNVCVPSNAVGWRFADGELATIKSFTLCTYSLYLFSFAAATKPFNIVILNAKSVKLLSDGGSCGFLQFVYMLSTDGWLTLENASTKIALAVWLHYYMDKTVKPKPHTHIHSVRSERVIHNSLYTTLSNAHFHRPNNRPPWGANPSVQTINPSLSVSGCDCVFYSKLIWLIETFARHHTYTHTSPAGEESKQRNRGQWSEQ